MYVVALCRFGIKYPQMYAEASHPAAMVFNCYQRAHQVKSTCSHDVPFHYGAVPRDTFAVGLDFLVEAYRTSYIQLVLKSRPGEKTLRSPRDKNEGMHRVRS